jgi:serine/threonine protein kinase
MQVDNLILEKLIGKGSFGEVHLTRISGDTKLYATKVYDRERIENTDAFKYLSNEINIMHNLNHPNIIKFIQVKKTKKHYYIVMEFCNGGELEKALEKYQLKYGKPFSEEIVQHLMRQIISAFKYMHENNIMHRDIKLENILVNFENEKDKNDLNMMKATVKIIDFGFACKIDKDSLTYTTIGNPMNMSPLILKKLTSHGKVRQLGYDMKADIWSLGAICYQMLIGKAAFDADDIDELVEKIEKGIYKVPTNLSKEVVSFLNGMLQYEPQARLTAEQLYNHQFLQENIQNFHTIDLNQVSNRVKKNELEIDTKKNKSIWAIFNEDVENKLNKISPGHLAPINEVPENNYIPQQKTFNQEPMNKNNMTNAQTIKNTNTFEANQLPSMMNNGYNYNQNYNNPYYGPILPRGQQGFQNIPGNIYQNNGPSPTLSGQPMSETNYICSENIYNK